MNILSQITVGLMFSVVVGWLAYRRGSLSRSGVAGAIIIGTTIFGFGGWVWGLTLITFFVTSSLLSHYKLAAKEKLAEKFDKGHRREEGSSPRFLRFRSKPETIGFKALSRLVSAARRAPERLLLFLRTLPIKSPGGS